MDRVDGRLDSDAGSMGQSWSSTASGTGASSDAEGSRVDQPKNDMKVKVGHG